jgi:hypothetical protein
VTAEIAVGEPELALEIGEVGSGQTADCGQDSKPNALMDVVIQVMDRMVGQLTLLS